MTPEERAREIITFYVNQGYVPQREMKPLVAALKNDFEAAQAEARTKALEEAAQIADEEMARASWTQDSIARCTSRLIARRIRALKDERTEAGEA